MRSDRRGLLDPLHLGAGDVEGFITAFVNNLVQLLEPDLVSWLQRLLWMIRVLATTTHALASPTRTSSTRPAPAAGLDASQIRQTRANALEIAFLTSEERSRLLGAAPG